jgi:uncharacterized protein YndB with AHSA1/START domain
MKMTEVTVTRTIRASADEIYDVWLDPKSLGGPWAGSTKVIVDAKVDGLFYQAAEHEGRVWPHYGRFVKLDKGRRIEHTWVSEATHGIESIVTITLEPMGDATEMKLHHSKIPDDEMGRGHKDGWEWVLNMVAERLEARPS